MIPQTAIDEILTARQQQLQRKQTKTPIPAIIALADMQTRPLPVLNVVTGGDYLTVIGQVRLQATYDPVAAGLRFVRYGVDAVTLFTDMTIYSKGMEDLLLMARALKHTPVISQNYILSTYNLLETRASGADGTILYADHLEATTLRDVVSLCQRCKMSTIVQVSDAAGMDAMHALVPHAVAIGTEPTFAAARDLPLLADLRQRLPHYTRFLPYGTVQSFDDLSTLVDFGVDAVIVDESLLNTPQRREQFETCIGRALT
jgi:indole-3-glycerol phosphate synthase